MKIILSPAKKMKKDDDLGFYDLPIFLDKTKGILKCLKSLSKDELKEIWKCNEKIADENMDRLEKMNLEGDLTPAILAYDGIAYKYMAPSVFEDSQFSYIQEHLRMLSAFYGVLKPMDGVRPYRLEMQAKLRVGDYKDLYAYWGDNLYKSIVDESRVIINLASKEYSKCIEKYLNESDRYITITFCELLNGKLVTKGTYAKMARGEMVRYMAENNIYDVEKIKSFDRLDYVYRDELSSDDEYVFEKVSK